MSKETDLQAFADDVRDFVDQETPDVAEWRQNGNVLRDALEYIGPAFTDTDTAHAALLAKFNADHDDTTGAHSAPSEWVRLSGTNSTPLFVNSSQFQLVGNWTNNFAIADRVRAQLATNVFVIAAVKTVAFDVGSNRTTLTLDASVLTSALQTIDTALERHSQPKIQPVDLWPTVLRNGMLRGVTIEVESATPTQAAITFREASIQGMALSVFPSSGAAFVLPLSTAAGNGALKLDAGSWVAGTHYAVHICTNDFGTALTVIASLSATAPTLPASYTRFIHVGYIRTDNGTATNLVSMRQENGRVDTAHVQAFSQSVAPATSHVVDLSTLLPPDVRVAYLSFYFSSSTSEPGFRQLFTAPGNSFPGVGIANAVMVLNKNGPAGLGESGYVASWRQRLDASRRFVLHVTNPVADLTNSTVQATVVGWEEPRAA